MEFIVTDHTKVALAIVLGIAFIYVALNCLAILTIKPRVKIDFTFKEMIEFHAVAIVLFLVLSLTFNFIGFKNG